MGIAWLLAAIPACQQPPQEPWTDLQQVRRSLRAEEAERYCPQGFRRFESEYLQLQREYARLQGRSFLGRDPAPVAARIEAARRQGVGLLEQTRLLKAELEEEQRQRLRLVEEDLSRFASFGGYPGVQEKVAQVRLKARQAGRLWRQGNYPEAGQLLDQILHLYDQIDLQIEALQRRYTDPRVLERWRRWSLQTVLWSRQQDTYALVVEKSVRQARLYRGGRLVRTYSIELGRNGLLDKIREGDGATPEGEYRVVKKKSGSQTRYYLALLLDYPSPADWAAFQERVRRGELEEEAGIGSLIEIHGEGGQGADWTEGCIALDNREMEDLFQKAYPGMPVTIVGRVEP